eukprot:CAMPEP_0170555140 /NCGR_PEP_ID=MMETSP0211-20121228/13025_1 /TAXON_ID=311385 /ORGANISM="Pseudokeronopsis sp., Strain OXSARD2" /LENGTH=167 /DNA_ID=CAMNT_0010864753 /DNA_START=33 /DNA_END=536 /DNA_ORIENTATION=-
MTKEDPYYSELKKDVPIVGVWDDHDYGMNNGDKTNLIKKEMRELYLEFLEEPAESERYRFNETGIFQEYLINEQGIKVSLILLDIRFDHDSDINDYFGDLQLEWLEKVLKDSKDADITLIGMGIQVLPHRVFITECLGWKNKKVLLNLIKESERSGVFFLSGDVHFA